MVEFYFSVLNQISLIYFCIFCVFLYKNSILSDFVVFYFSFCRTTISFLFQDPAFKKKEFQ